MLRHIIAQLKKSIPYLGWFFGQFFYMLRKKGFRAAWNYIHTLLFTIEDGVGLLMPIYTKNHRKLKYPSRLELEVTTKCFLKCLKCEQTYWDEPQKDLTYEQFLHVMSQFPKLKTISLSGIGHNFQNPDFMKMVKYTTGKGIYTQFFDTLLLWDDEIIADLVDNCVAKIWMSIDGVTPEVVEKLQRGSNFNKVVGNARKLMEEKKKKKSRFPELGFTVVVTKDNVHQLADFIGLFESIVSDVQDVVFVQFIRLIPFEENEFLMPTYESLRKNRLLATEAAQKSPVKFRLNFEHFDYLIEENKLPIECCTAWIVPFLTVDGVVYPCCALTEGNMRSLVDPHAFGNVFEKDFKDIYNSSKFVKFREMLNNKQVPPLCHLYRDCTEIKTGPALREKPCSKCNSKSVTLS